MTNLNHHLFMKTNFLNFFNNEHLIHEFDTYLKHDSCLLCDDRATSEQKQFPLGMFREICQYNWHIIICCDLTCGIVSRWHVAGRRGLLTFVVFVVETNIWCFWVESCVAFAFPVVLVLYCDYTLADNLIHPVDVWATCPVHCLHDPEVLPMGFSYNLYDLLFILIPRQHTKLHL